MCSRFIERSTVRNAGVHPLFVVACLEKLYNPDVLGDLGSRTMIPEC